MSISTYAELKSAIADWLNRSDLTSVIPTFVSMAEADLNRTVRHWRMEKRSTAEADGQYLDLPNDWIENIRVKTTDGGTAALELISQADLAERRQAGNDTAGVPAFYCITGGQLEFYPTPSATYDVEIVYYAQLDALSADGDANWLLTSHPDAYLYSALTHAAPYLDDDARTQVWASLAQKAVAAINLENDKARFSGTGLRMKLRSL